MISSSRLGLSLIRSFRRALARRMSRSSRRSARGLAALAGRSRGFDALEPLEARQLLFTVSIGSGDVDPTTGIGTVRIPDFAYAIPFLNRAVPMNVADQTVTEEFADENGANWAMFFPPVPPSGTNFLTSNIRISYRTQSNAPAILVAGPDPTQQGANDLDLRISLATTDQMTFSFLGGDDQNLVPRLTKRARITVGNATPGQGGGDGDAIKTDAQMGTRIELLLEGQVVGVLSGAALDAVAQQVFNGQTQYTISRDAGFDAIRFASAADIPDNGTYSDVFLLDDISVDFPAGRFGQYSADRASFGVQGFFSGPVGASIRFLDLYGNDMIATCDTQIPQNSVVANIDRNDDGIPDFNDGIGQIIISGGDSNTNVSLWGTRVVMVDNAFVCQLPDALGGFYSAFETAGFGYTLNNATPPQVIGLPTSGASIIIGSPFVRNRSSTNAYTGTAAFPPTPDQFVRQDQGIFVNGNVGSININALLHGSSSITGSAGRIAVGTLMGSVRVEGDLGQLIVAGDAGLWQRDDNVNTGDAQDGRIFNPSNSQLIVGRTVGEVLVGGRSNLDVTVFGDINNPNRAVRSALNYAERELALGQQPAAQNPIANAIFTSMSRNGSAGAEFVAFGSSLFRNDGVQDAEFIGYNGTTVRVTGGLGGRDAINTVEDTTDVYAFAADPSQEVVIQSSSANAGLYFRVVDRLGNSIAVIDNGSAGRGPGGNRTAGSIMRFRPDHADVYYLVVSGAPDNGVGVSGVYDITVAGMAPVTFGAFRTALGAGGGTDPFVLSLNAGNMGSLRIATGAIGSDGALMQFGQIVNTNENLDNLFDLQVSTSSIAGNLYSVYLGGDAEGGQVLVGRNFGSLATGQALPFLGAITQGDLTTFDLRVGGTIARLDIQGAVAADQDPDPVDNASGAVNIRTGTLGGAGHLAQFLVGAYVGTGLNVQTSPGSIVDQFLVGNTNDGAGSQFGGNLRGVVPTFRLGAGSDLRFADFNLIQTNGSADAFTRINYGQSFTFVDDAGAAVRVSIIAGPGFQAGVTDSSTVDVRTLAINGSQGVAVSRITGQLLGGARLNIEAITTGVVSIGRIDITTDQLGSEILMSGVGEIDVFRINILGAGQLEAVRNSTVGGDIVAIDAVALHQVVITGGNLGITQTSPVINASSLAKFLGLAAGRGGGGGGGGGVGGPIGVSVNAINQQNAASFDQWDGQGILFPINPDAIDSWNNPFDLELIGSPVDAYLSGVIVRGGDLNNVRVSGAVGDVIVENGDLLTLVANSDSVTPTGEFHGIVGNVYAAAINDVDVGDGLLGTGPTPFAKASIVADDDIVLVHADRIAGARIEGVIMAANLNTAARTTIGNEMPTNLVVPVNGIGEVRVRNGRYDGAFIHAGALDDFWNSTIIGKAQAFAGDIRLVSAFNADLFRSTVSGIQIAQINISGGAYDGSQTQATGSITSISADSYRNTTALGEAGEFVANSISATNNIGSIVTTQNGNMSDLSISAGGTITGQVAARNIERSSFAVNNQIAAINVANDFRGNSIVSGELVSLNVLGDIRSSSVSVAGPIRSLIATGEITFLDLISSGPFGRIDLIRSGKRLSGSFTSSGPIGTMESLTEDIIANVSTTDPTDGNLGTLRAGRDLRVDLQVFGNVELLQAGRHIGALGEPRSRALDIRGNLANVMAPNGQIYSDILVGQSITGAIVNGRVNMRQGSDQVASADIIAFGRINSLMLHGDFNGDIISFSGGLGSVIITDGSFRPGNRIAAYDGDITLLRIKGGDLLGNVYTEGNLTNLEVLNGDDGFKGQIGVASFRLNGRRWKTDIRNELPPNVSRSVGVDGVTIQALGNIDRIFVQQGSIWESRIIAGDTIGLIDVGLQFRNDALTSGRTNIVAAGNRIDTVRTGQFAGGLYVLAGLKSFGDDNAPGGTGSNADTVVAGQINLLQFAKDVGNVTIGAGVDAGFNGQYLTSDDTFAPGFSSIGTVFVGGAKNAIKAYSAGSLGSASAGIVTDLAQPQSKPTLVVGITGVQATNGVPFNFVTTTGQSGSFTYTGAGRAFWNAARNRITVDGAGSSLVVNAAANILTDFNILSTDNATLDSLVVNAELRGDSNVFIDRTLGTAVFNRRVDSAGIIGSGGNVASLTFNGGLFDGDVQTRGLGMLDVVGDLGRTGSLSDVIVLVRDLDLLRVTGGVFAGTVSSELDIDSVLLGTVNEGGVRAGRAIGAITTAGVSKSRFSARDTVGAANFNGNFFDSVLLAGVDLGTDANFGGTGSAADLVTNGLITSVNVAGNFLESDISAGVLRGVDGFLGTEDDRAADGRSTIGTVVITGNQVGSNLNSEQYRIISTGTVGSVSVGSLPFTSRNNFRVTRLEGNPVPVQVFTSRTIEDGRVYTHEITFNQPIDASTIPAALNIAQVRDGNVFIGLALGTDYTYKYNANTFTLSITFSRNITDRSLPVQPGIPGPGLFRIVLAAQQLRGQTQLSILDGNNDGSAGDDFSDDNIIGDVGDKINAGNPNSVPGVDFYGAANLDLFLDSNSDSDDLPDVNAPRILRGVLGDHPDANSNTFRVGGDVDVYRVSLRAGQILRLGSIQGIALTAQRGVYDSAGNLIAFSGGAGQRTVVDPNGPVRQLPAADAFNVGDVTGNDEYLVLQTGTYFLAVGSNVQAANIADINAVLNAAPSPGAIGSYSFSVEVFDDGDTGFVGDSNSGDGQLLPKPPVPQDFAGIDGIPGNNDDLTVYVSGDFTFTWDRKNLANAADDIIRGTNSAGTVSITRINGTDLVWGNGTDRIEHTVSSAIGTPGNTGTPNSVQPDVDVYRLNGGQPIAPGTSFTATLRLTETGSNIGIGSVGGLSNVQFALFEVPAGTTLSNARLIGAPSDFLPIGGQASASKSNGAFTYGYNADGDFFIKFAVPGAVGVAGQVPASYALYIQGVIRSDYQLNVVQVSKATFVPAVQRVLLETRGGTINWLEAGQGVTTTLESFRAAAAGFAGQIDGQDVDDYIRSNLVSRLNDIFTNANANIILSYNPVDFEGLPSSTVFLAGNSEPNAFFNNNTFGASQHIDAFNADATDQGVVYVTSLTTLGNDPSQAGVDRFITQFAGAVARRIGELVGLSFETDNASAVSPVPVIASNSIFTPPAGAGVYGFNSTVRNLAGRTDTANTQVFFMGSQNSLGLLNRLVAAKF